MSIDAIAGVDIGGSHAEVCLLRYDDEQRLRLLDSMSEELHSREQEEVVDLVARLIRSLEMKHNAAVVAIGVGCPGQAMDGVLVAASNFPSWHRVPLLKMLGERFPSAGRGLCLLNDSDAALAGELWSPESSFISA
jgi:predicted NBD/HSP70 family sugar kinase